MACDNLRFLSCLAHLIFQKEIQYAIDIINVIKYFDINLLLIFYLISKFLNFYFKESKSMLGEINQHETDNSK